MNAVITYTSGMCIGNAGYGTNSCTNISKKSTCTIYIPYTKFEKFMLAWLLFVLSLNTDSRNANTATPHVSDSMSSPE